MDISVPQKLTEVFAATCVSDPGIVLQINHLGEKGIPEVDSRFLEFFSPSPAFGETMTEPTSKGRTDQPETKAAKNTPICFEHRNQTAYVYIVHQFPFIVFTTDPSNQEGVALVRIVNFDQEQFNFLLGLIPGCIAGVFLFELCLKLHGRYKHLRWWRAYRKKYNVTD